MVHLPLHSTNNSRGLEPFLPIPTTTSTWHLSPGRSPLQGLSLVPLTPHLSWQRLDKQQGLKELRGTQLPTTVYCTGATGSSQPREVWPQGAMCPDPNPNPPGTSVFTNLEVSWVFF